MLTLIVHSSPFYFQLNVIITMESMRSEINDNGFEIGYGGKRQRIPLRSNAELHLNIIEGQMSEPTLTYHPSNANGREESETDVETTEDDATTEDDQTTDDETTEVFTPTVPDTNKPIDTNLRPTEENFIKQSKKMGCIPFVNNVYNSLKQKIKKTKMGENKKKGNADKVKVDN